MIWCGRNASLQIRHAVNVGLHARHYCVLFCCFAVLVALQPGQCQVVMPNFGIVGQKGGDVGELWEKNADDHVFPKQLAMDFNKQGVIYGFVCEYGWSPDVLKEIEAKVAKSIKGKQRSPKTEYLVWRDENRKLAISLFLDTTIRLRRWGVCGTCFSLGRYAGNEV